MISMRVKIARWLSMIVEAERWESESTMRPRPTLNTSLWIVISIKSLTDPTRKCNIPTQYSKHSKSTGYHHPQTFNCILMMGIQSVLSWPWFIISVDSILTWDRKNTFKAQIINLKLMKTIFYLIKPIISKRFVNFLLFFGYCLVRHLYI